MQWICPFAGVNCLVRFGENPPITVRQMLEQIAYNAMSRNVKESGKVIPDPRPVSDQQQN